MQHKTVQTTLPDFTPEDEGLEVLVIGVRCWGRGNTLRKAMKNARAEHSRLDGKFRALSVYLVDSAAYVDDMGNLMRPQGSKQSKKVLDLTGCVPVPETE